MVPAGITSSGEELVACAEGMIAMVGSPVPARDELGTAMLLLLMIGLRRGEVLEKGSSAAGFVLLLGENFAAPELVGPSRARRKAARTASSRFGSELVPGGASAANKVWFHNPRQVSNENKIVFTVV